MHLRSSLRLLGAVALATSVAACGAGAGRLSDRAASSQRATDPTPPPATVTTSSPQPAAAISTTEAADLLRQVDDLLGQADTSIAADRDAAQNLGE